MISSALLLMLFDLAVVVDGDVACPAPEAVARELATLMPADGVVREPDLADLSREGSDLHLELRRGDGSWVAVRDIAGTRSCEELAVAAAVVIAAWEADLASGSAESVDLGRRTRPRPRHRPATPASPTLLAMATPNPSGPPMPVVVGPKPAQAPKAAGHPETELALGLGGTIAGSDVAAALVADVAVKPRDFPLAIRVGMNLSTSHQIELPDALGTVTWERFSLETGVSYRVPGASTYLDLHTSLRGAVLHLQLDANPDLTNFMARTVADFGLGTGVRLGFGVPGQRRILPWVGLDFGAWSRAAIVKFESSEVTIPTLDVALTVGLTGGT